MKSRCLLFLCLFVAFGVPQFSLYEAAAQSSQIKRTLKINLNYTGGGTVDEKHKIYVLLFDANPVTASTLVDSMAQAPPPAPAPGVSHIIARESASTKNGTVVFTNLAVSPVFAMAFFDKSGSYNGHLDSSSGSPMGVYGTMPDMLQPISVKPDQTLRIALTFDDSKTTP